MLEQQVEQEVPKRLAELLGVRVEDAQVERVSKGTGSRADILFTAGKRVFLLETKASGRAESVAGAVTQGKEHARSMGQKVTPLVVVPYMGEVGKRICAEAGVGWMDLSGNAYLSMPGVRVDIEGRPNLFKRRGRPSTVFAPRSSRIARWLLMEPAREFTQRELARISDLDEGFTSRIVRQLEEQRLVKRTATRAVKVSDAAVLLDAWREMYDFARHHIVRGHIAARSSDDILRQATATLAHDGMEYAVTGLAGAWLVHAFAGFRLVTIYTSRIPSASVQKEMGFREEPRGENVWLVVPNDEGVFHGATDRSGIRCAHPVQVYLDLKDHPERSAEAAEPLRQVVLQGATS